MIQHVVIGVIMLLVFIGTTSTGALDYGDGTYGSCTYDTCGITVTSSTTVSLPITPSASTVCSVNNDAVSVTTGATVGYTMTLSSSTAAVTLPGDTNGGTINPVAGTYAAPVALAANTWGYRIDSTGNFGAGPTTSETNVAVPSESYAPLAPIGSAQTIKSTSGAAEPDNTDVWYGVCVDSSIPADNYSRQVAYTASTN